MAAEDAAPTTIEDVITEGTETVETTPDTPDAPTERHWSRGEALDLDDETVGWLENKGFENVQAAITSQRELEKKMGGPPEMLQKWPESDDKEGFEGIYRRMGKPEEASKYDFKFEEGAEVDKDTLEWFKGTAFARNMTNEQAQGVMEDWNTEVARLQADQAQALEVRDKTEETELRSDWGTKYDERIDYGHRAMIALGMKEEKIDLLQEVLGPKELAQFAAKIADTMGEDSIAESTDTPAFGTTKEQVQNSINELAAEFAADTKRYDKYYADHKVEKEATGKDFRKMKQLEVQLENLIKAGA